MSNFWSINLKSNIRKFYLISFFEALWFPLPIFILFLLHSGLDLGQVGILLSALVIAQVIFEIPSSIWADKYSRKNILIIGTIFSLFSSLIFFLKDSFEYFFIAMIFMGFSSALKSGTDSAIVYDTLLNMGEEKKYDKTQSKIMVCFFWSRIVASVAGALAYATNFKLSFLLAVFSGLGALFVLSFVKEPTYHKSIGSHFSQVKDGLKFLMKENNVWLIIVSFSLMLATSDVLFYYYQPVLDSAGITVLYLSFIYVGINLSSSIGSMAYPYLKKKFSQEKILAFYFFIVILCSLAFMTKNLIIILFFIALLSFNFGSQYIYITGLINRIVPSSHRATTISIQSQFYLLLFSIIIVIVGKFSSDYSIFYGMAVNLLIALIASIVFAAVKFNNKKNDKFLI